MSIQGQIAPYSNRFVLLFNQNATAQLDVSCSEGRVSVNTSHDLGAVSKTPPTHQAEKQKYSDILKKSVSPSQLRRLKKRAETRAEKAKVPIQNNGNTAEKAIEEISKAVEEAEKVKKEAINAKQEAEKAKTEAEDAKAELENYKAMIKDKKCTRCLNTFDSAAEMTDHINQVHNYPCSICSLCAESHKILQRHWKSEEEEVFCEFCGHGEFSCEAIFKHIESKHKKARFKRYNHPYS